MSDSFEQPCKFCDEPKPMVRLTKDSGGKWDVSEMKEGKRVPHEHNNKKKGSGNWPKKPQIQVNVNFDASNLSKDEIQSLLIFLKELQS